MKAMKTYTMFILALDRVVHCDTLWSQWYPQCDCTQYCSLNLNTVWTQCLPRVVYTVAYSDHSKNPSVTTLVTGVKQQRLFVKNTMFTLFLKHFVTHCYFKQNHQVYTPQCNHAPSEIGTLSFLFFLFLYSDPWTDDDPPPEEKDTLFEGGTYTFLFRL